MHETLHFRGLAGQRLPVSRSPGCAADAPGLRLGSSLPVQALAAILIGYLALDNFLLMRFLGLSWAIVGPAAAAGSAALAYLTWKSGSKGSAARVSWARLLACMATAALLLVLAGEGRLFFANEDWQLRDSLLADMARNPWPYTYAIQGEAYIARAPIGMYLLPALLGAGGIVTRDLSLLLCNSLLLGLILALSSALFSTARQRWTAFCVCLFFSGLDILGTLFMSSAGLRMSFDHIEWWTLASQYSSHITMIFWVPHHAFAGWICAVLFLLVQQKKLPIGILAASLPLTALWSPLALMGAVPFAMLAGLQALKNRVVQFSDIGLGAAATAISIPSLLYLRLESGEVPHGFGTPSWTAYGLGLLFEVIPFAVLIARMKAPSPAGKISAWLAIACLVVLPLYQIGINGDFQMRATIVPLAILSVAIAKLVACRTETRQSRAWVITACLILSIGSVTGLLELKRAFLYRTTPAPQCSLIGIWTRQSNTHPGPISTYLARKASLPGFVQEQSAFTADRRQSPENCWSRPWRVLK